MPASKLSPNELRAALTAHTNWLIKERDHYAMRYRQASFDSDRESANDLHHVLWMLASATRDEFGDRGEETGLPFPLKTQSVSAPADVASAAAAVFPAS